MAGFIAFDQYQRYSLIRKILQPIVNGRKQILEIGGAFSPLKEMMPGEPILELDIIRGDTGIDLRTTALALPFHSDSVPVVVTTDVLEHLPQSDRNRFIEEVFRVASDIVLIGFPAGKAAEEADASLLDFLKVTLHADSSFLREHVEFGLPCESDVKKQIDSLATAVLEFQNANLESWLPMMKCNFVLEQHPELDPIRAFINNTFNERFGSSCNDSPSYRKVFLAMKRGMLPQFVFEDQTSTESIEYARNALDLSIQIKRIVETHNSEIALRNMMIQEQQEQLNRTAAQLENLQNYLDLFLNHPAYRIYKSAKKILGR